MAEALWLVTKAESEGPNKTLVNGIHACIINSDDGDAAAVVIAAAEAQCVVGGHAVPSGYFDTVSEISDLTAGDLKDDDDTLIFLERSVQTVQG